MHYHRNTGYSLEPNVGYLDCVRQGVASKSNLKLKCIHTIQFTVQEMLKSKAWSPLKTEAWSWVLM